MKFKILLFLIVLLNQYGFAQTATEVYLLDNKKDGTSFSIAPNTKPVNISNNEGYDNQPSFIEKLNAVAFVSSRNNNPQSTDVQIDELNGEVDETWKYKGSNKYVDEFTIEFTNGKLKSVRQFKDH